MGEQLSRFHRIERLGDWLTAPFFYNSDRHRRRSLHSGRHRLRGAAGAWSNVSTSAWPCCCRPQLAWRAPGARVWRADKPEPRPLGSSSPSKCRGSPKRAEEKQKGAGRKHVHHHGHHGLASPELQARDFHPGSGQSKTHTLPVGSSDTGRPLAAERSIASQDLGRLDPIIGISQRLSSITSRIDKTGYRFSGEPANPPDSGRCHAKEIRVLAVTAAVKLKGTIV